MATKPSLSPLSIAIAAGMMLVLAGCMGSTNPETASLLDNIKNLSSGEYDRQIAANQAEAAAIKRNNTTAQSEIAGLETQKRANASAIASMRSQIARTRQSASAARAAAAGNQARLDQVSALDAQLAAVSEEVNAGTADPAITQDELRRIRAAYHAISG